MSETKPGELDEWMFIGTHVRDERFELIFDGPIPLRKEKFSLVRKTDYDKVWNDLLQESVSVDQLLTRNERLVKALEKYAAIQNNLGDEAREALSENNESKPESNSEGE